MVEYVLTVIIFMGEGQLIVQITANSCQEALQALVGSLYGQYPIKVYDCHAVIEV